LFYKKFIFLLIAERQAASQGRLRLMNSDSEICNRRFGHDSPQPMLIHCAKQTTNNCFLIPDKILRNNSGRNEQGTRALGYKLSKHMERSAHYHFEAKYSPNGYLNIRFQPHVQQTSGVQRRGLCSVQCEKLRNHIYTLCGKNARLWKVKLHIVTTVFTVLKYMSVRQIADYPSGRFLLLAFSYNNYIFVVCFLLGDSTTSEVYMPTFWNTSFYLHRRV
jgi:hypothetical protein